MFLRPRLAQTANTKAVNKRVLPVALFKYITHKVKTIIDFFNIFQLFVSIQLLIKTMFGVELIVWAKKYSLLSAGHTLIR
jgi:hypothetical protein